MPFAAKAFNALDAITPGDISGNYATLKEGGLAKNWLTRKEARGKVLFLMITAVGPADTAAYLQGHPSLKGRMAFLSAKLSEDNSAFIMFDNVLLRRTEIGRV